MSYDLEAQCMKTAKAVQDKFSKLGISIATAESCTGGLIATYMTAHSGSSCFFEGGVVPYSNQAKVDSLFVNPESIEKNGAVSEQVCREMVIGCLKRFHSGLAIATTGIAGPTGATPGKPVGTVFVGVGDAATVVVKRLQLEGDRHIIRGQTTLHVLEWLNQWNALSRER